MTWAMIAAALILAGVIFTTQRTLGKQLVVIHDLVNSNLTRVTAYLTMAQQRIEVLEAHIAKEKR